MKTIKWKCNYCNDIVTSSSNERWKMDVCKCGKSGVDLEESYCRGMGDTTTLEIINS